MNEFALQVGAVICRAAMAITSAKAGCYDSAVLGRMAGWQSLVLLSQPSPAGDSVLVEDPADFEAASCAAIRSTAVGNQLKQEPANR